MNDSSEKLDGDEEKLAANSAASRFHSAEASHQLHEQAEAVGQCVEQLTNEYSYFIFHFSFPCFLNNFLSK